MPIELEITWVAKADDLFACDPLRRTQIDCDRSGIGRGPGDRTSERRQKQKRFSHSVFRGNVELTNQMVNAAVEVPKLYLVTTIARARG